MAIKYKSIQKAQSGMAGGDAKKFYTFIVIDDESTVYDPIKVIEKFSTLGKPDVCGIIVALENVIRNKLAESKSVRLEKPGMFYPTLHNESRNTEEESDDRVIRSVGINYHPGIHILLTLRGTGKRKVKYGMNNKKHTPHTLHGMLSFTRQQVGCGTSPNSKEH
jgi:predicted histone-like DNA-binding protein